MTKDRGQFGDLVFEVVDAEDEPPRWRNARLRREKASQPRPVPSCVPDLSLGATQWVYILCLGEVVSTKVVCDGPGEQWALNVEAAIA